MNTDSSRAIIDEDILANTAAVSEMTIQTLRCHRDQIQKKIDDEDPGPTIAKGEMRIVRSRIDSAIYFYERALNQIHLAAEYNQLDLTDNAA